MSSPEVSDNDDDDNGGAVGKSTERVRPATESSAIVMPPTEKALLLYNRQCEDDARLSAVTAFAYDQYRWRIDQAPPKEISFSDSERTMYTCAFWGDIVNRYVGVCNVVSGAARVEATLFSPQFNDVLVVSGALSRKTQSARGLHRTRKSTRCHETVHSQEEVRSSFMATILTRFRDVPFVSEYSSSSGGYGISVPCFNPGTGTPGGSLRPYMCGFMYCEETNSCHCVARVGHQVEQQRFMAYLRESSDLTYGELHKSREFARLNDLSVQYALSFVASVIAHHGFTCNTEPLALRHCSSMVATSDARGRERGPFLFNILNECVPGDEITPKSAVPVYTNPHKGISVITRAPKFDEGVWPTCLQYPSHVMPPRPSHAQQAIQDRMFRVRRGGATSHGKKNESNSNSTSNSSNGDDEDSRWERCYISHPSYKQRDYYTPRELNELGVYYGPSKGIPVESPTALITWESSAQTHPVITRHAPELQDTTLEIGSSLELKPMLVVLNSPFGIQTTARS